MHVLPNPAMLPLLCCSALVSALIPIQSTWTRSLKEEEFVAGRIVVPTLARRIRSRKEMKQLRDRMFAEGVYPGVDYIIETIERPRNGPAILRVRPEYALIPKLERNWPVRVPVSVSPDWMTPAGYNAQVAIFALGLALTGLLGALAASTVLTLSVITSTSMAPTILPRDVLLVEKVSRRFHAPLRRGDLVFFEPPAELREIVRARAAAAGVAEPRRYGRLFVKRVVAAEDDVVGVDDHGHVTLNGGDIGADVDPNGPLASLVKMQQTLPLASGKYFVLGDNADSSVDSRCWGGLDEADIVGRPVVRVFPLSRFGPL